MSDIKVSVCIISFNQQNYIRQCLDGVFSQKTNFEYEVIIRDDCSTDNTYLT
ncbi:glycosyltransferase, partial [Escherichia coli]|nr:glycosyltransferase [Escherichia coli]